MRVCACARVHTRTQEDHSREPQKVVQTNAPGSDLCARLCGGHGEKGAFVSSRIERNTGKMLRAAGGEALLRWGR